MTRLEELNLVYSRRDQCAVHEVILDGVGTRR